MEHDIHTPQSINPPTARELELVVRLLWTTEPRCPPTDRTSLLIELGSVGLALERIILREAQSVGRAETDDDPRFTDLAECDRRIRNLLAHWPDDLEARPPLLVAA